MERGREGGEMEEERGRERYAIQLFISGLHSNARLWMLGKDPSQFAFIFCLMSGRESINRKNHK